MDRWRSLRNSARPLLLRMFKITVNTGWMSWFAPSGFPPMNRNMRCSWAITAAWIPERYVSIGDGNVYLVQNDPLDQFDAVLSDMIDHDDVPPLRCRGFDPIFRR